MFYSSEFNLIPISEDFVQLILIVVVKFEWSILEMKTINEGLIFNNKFDITMLSEISSA